MTTLASFLLPTRGRVERLVRSLSSLHNAATQKGCYEVLLRADLDDDDTVKMLTWHAKHDTRLNVTLGSRGRGYLDLHLMCNQLCTLASGEFIVLWNDDATMLTQGWDDVLRSHLADPPRVYKPSSPGHRRNIFPIVRRSVYRAMGRFSESALNDFYVSAVARGAGIEAPVAIEVQHDHPFQGGTVLDQTYLDAVEANKVCKHDDTDPRIVACISEDTERVKQLLAKQPAA